MNARSRQARRTIKARSTQTRAQARAIRKLHAGGPQTAKTLLVGNGLTVALADRFAGAFSRGVTPTATVTTVIKLRGRVTKNVPVKLYDLPTFTARLAVYRPKNPTAAAAFAALAA